MDKITNLAISKLPTDVREKLADLQQPADDRFVFLLKPAKWNWIAVPALVGWLAYLFASTQAYIWEWWMFALLLGGTILFTVLAVFSVYRLVRAKTAKISDGSIFTHNECIVTSGDSLEFWPLSDLEGFQYREDIKTIEIWVGTRLVKLKADDDAQRLYDIFTDWRSRSGPSFLTDFANSGTAFRPASRLVAIGGLAVAGIIIATALTFTASAVNRNYDDGRTWARVQNATTVADFEEYVRTHPNGSYRAEADRKINEIYTRVGQEYKQKIKKNANEKAVAALTGILSKAGEMPARKIYVTVREKLELDDAVVKKMRSETGYQIATYDYSVPPADGPYRREELSGDLGVAFVPVLKPASFEFVLSDAPPANSLVADISFTAKPVETFYRYVWFSNGRPTTFFKPAAQFDFEFVLKGTDGGELYRTTYTSLFTNLGSTGIVDQRDAANYSFDKMYFNSVSEDFSNHIAREFGIIE